MRILRWFSFVLTGLRVRAPCGAGRSRRADYPKKPFRCCGRSMPVASVLVSTPLDTDAVDSSPPAETPARPITEPSDVVRDQAEDRAPRPGAARRARPPCRIRGRRAAPRSFRRAGARRGGRAGDLEQRAHRAPVRQLRYRGAFE